MPDVGTSTQGTATQVEWALLLDASSASPQPEKTDHLLQYVQHPIAWQVVLDLAEHHGVSSLLFQSLSLITEKVPAEVLGSLQQRYGENVRKCLLLARELVRLLDCLDAHNIEVIPYKGLALSETGYGDIAVRQSGDIDLLIRPRDFARARSALRDLGYKPRVVLTESQERSYLVSGYECVFDGAAGPNLLELQWALQPRFYAVDIDLDKLFDRAETVSVAGRNMRGLSREDLLLVLSIHAAKHVWSRLIWLCDISRAAKQPGMNWQRIEDQARQLGIERILHVGLLLASRLLRSPAFNWSSLPGDAVAQSLAGEIQAEIFRGRPCDADSPTYFRRMLRLRERTRDRMLFLQRLALTPGPSEWKAVRLPAPLFPLYRLVRLSRLVTRFGRA